jgi:hypothetical protein
MKNGRAIAVRVFTTDNFSRLPLCGALFGFEAHGGTVFLHSKSAEPNRYPMYSEIQFCTDIGTIETWTRVLLSI